MTGTATTAELAQLFDEISAAWAAGDADAFTQRYAEDATAILPGYHLPGQSAIRAAMAPAFDGPLQGTRRVHEVQAVRELAPDVLVATTASSTLIGEETVAPVERQEWATWVLVRSAGEAWQVAAYHGSPVLAG